MHGSQGQDTTYNSSKKLPFKDVFFLRRFAFSSAFHFIRQYCESKTKHFNRLDVTLLIPGYYLAKSVSCSILVLPGP